MAELRPYEPTWRDRLASALLGDGRSAGRQQFVEGLLGSRGLGQTGMGLVDLTPAGVPLAVQESRQAFEQGSPVSGLLGAMAVLPAAKPAALAAKTAAGEAAQGIRAYHGSPYDFERFDLSKIGTGEGAQAYGHGLYFAEAEPVARNYRDTLKWKGAQADWNDPGYVAGYWLDNAGGDAAGAIKWLQSSLKSQSTPEARSAVEGAIELLKKGDAVKASPNPGKMYEVNIRANPEQFLDWDKPLKEQTEAVRNVFSSLGTPERLARVRGEDAYRALGETLGSLDWPINADAATRSAFRSRAATEASRVLREAGIPGIRYLDAGSRGVGEGSRNYVVFDDSLIDILRKYGLVGLLGGGAAAGAVSQQPEGM